jgi:hypothetical protein
MNMLPMWRGGRARQEDEEPQRGKQAGGVPDVMVWTRPGETQEYSASNGGQIHEAGGGGRAGHSEACISGTRSFTGPRASWIQEVCGLRISSRG